jgi:hypothetical protein
MTTNGHNPKHDVKPSNGQLSLQQCEVIALTALIAAQSSDGTSEWLVQIEDLTIKQLKQLANTIGIALHTSLGAMTCSDITNHRSPSAPSAIPLVGPVDSKPYTVIRVSNSGRPWAVQGPDGLLGAPVRGKGKMTRRWKNKDEAQRVADGFS